MKNLLRYALCFLLVLTLFGCENFTPRKRIVEKIISNFNDYSLILIEQHQIDVSVVESDNSRIEYWGSHSTAIAIQDHDTEYLFIDSTNPQKDWFNVQGDSCVIHLENNAQDDKSFDSYAIDIFINLSHPKMLTMVYAVVFRDGIKNGIEPMEFNYYNGNFSPSLSDLSEPEQKRDKRIKECISSDDLLRYYNNAIDLYEVLSSLS